MASTGCMEQLESIIFRFNAFGRQDDGSREEFTVIISAPEDSGEGDFFCYMSCPFFQANVFKMYGYDHEQVLENSINLVKVTLRELNARLVDGDGNEVQLPPSSAIEF